MIKNLFFTLAIIAHCVCLAQTVPTPKSHFGFSIGDNYMLANYTQTEAYFRKVAAASDRVKLVEMGSTEEGRRQLMLIVSSPANLAKLDQYKNISQKLARADGLTDEAAKALANEGKAIVWIDGGLHATEVVSPHQLIETVYQVVSRNDAETMRILDNVVILFAHVNPDGQELVGNWYMRETTPEKRSFNFLPRLYQKYIGHDNNRDFFMLNMKESQNISRQQYVEWMPQIVYNHHQAGPPGSVLAGPPYRDPFNYVYDPLLVTSIDAVGAAMNNRLNVEGKPGYTQRAGSQFSTWWNGGLRTTPYFHNMIGILTEIIGHPNPSRVPFIPNRLIPNGATPNPVVPQQWTFQRSIDYSVSLNYAILDYAVRHREQLLYNIYRMGKNSIEAGNRDNWTLSPRMIDSMKNAYRKDLKREFTSDTIPLKYYDLVLKDPSLRDARGYILPADQANFPTAVQFINALLRSGVQVHRATAAFTVNNKTYPIGSYVVKASQAFRPHVLDMFEPQDHPNDFQYPGGPPVPPYDAAGWTLAYQMGVNYDRVLNAFDGPFEAIAYGEVQSPKGSMPANAGAGYILAAQANESFIAVNDLLKAGVDVFRLTNNVSGNAVATQGSFFVPASAKAKTLLATAANTLGLHVGAVSKKPSSISGKIAPLRIALWDTYGGSMPSGWLRWMMEQYHFPFERIFAKEINAGSLKNKYDVIVFVGGAIPRAGLARDTSRGAARGPNPANIPEEYRQHLGSITADTSMPQIKQFLQDGGTVVALGSSTNLAYHLNLPVRNALTETVDGKERPLPRDKFFIPGSIMEVKIDSAQKQTWGMKANSTMYFDESPVFKIAPDAIVNGRIKPLAWFNTDKPLKSGWAWGQSYLQDAIAAFAAPIGKGQLVAFGPEIAFRAQTHSSFKLLFNQLYGVK
ncbi:MAG TPA: M14 metallopeptidase family protein [Flavisolibacter sp.]